MSLKLLRTLAILAAMVPHFSFSQGKQLSVIVSQPTQKSVSSGGVKPYAPAAQELPFIKRITERPVDLWDEPLPGMSKISPAVNPVTPAKPTLPVKSTTKKSLLKTPPKPVSSSKYKLIEQSGEYVGWHGIVRALTYDGEKHQTTVLLEHKYFDGLTDAGLHLVSLHGAGDFQIILQGKVTEELLPKLSLLKVYGYFPERSKTVTIPSPDCLRLWDWGLFAFMDYGVDQSNKDWIKLRDLKEGEIVYSASPDELYYETRLGKRKQGPLHASRDKEEAKPTP